MVKISSLYTIVYTNQHFLSLINKVIHITIGLYD